MTSLYEDARSLAVSWAINGPGSFGILGDAFTEQMDTLLSVFKNSTPRKYRQEARERAGNHDWLDRDQIGQIATSALKTIARSEELKAMAPNLTGSDLAFFSRAAYLIDSRRHGDDALALAGDWMQGIADQASESTSTLRDAMAEAAVTARAFQVAINDEVHALPGGDPEPLRAATEDLRMALDAAEPFAGARVSALEPALDAAQSALVRFAYDGRVIVEAEDTGAVQGQKEAQALEVALDSLGYPIPNALWMDPARQIDVVERAAAERAVRASLGLLEAMEGRFDLTDAAAAAAKAGLEESIQDAGYLLPKESASRAVSVAEQSARGTDEEILAILGAAATLVQAVGEDPASVMRATSTDISPLAANLAQFNYHGLSQALNQAGIFSQADAASAEIVTGLHPFDFAYVSKERLEGIQADDQDAVARRAADLLAERDPDEFAALLQWTTVNARNDIEAVARFNRELHNAGIRRDDVVVVLSEGIETARLEDIEYGRAEGILGENGASMAMNRGEAELVMKLVESVDKIVDKAYQHPESFEDAAFPVSLAANAVDAAHRLETETSVRSTLAHIAAGRRDALGLSREGAASLEAFIGTATDAMKAVVAQDDYVMKVVDQGAAAARTRGEDDVPNFAGEGVSLDEDSPTRDPLKDQHGDKKIIGQTMWNGWADRVKGNEDLKRNFIAALPGGLMTRLIKAHERMAARGAQLAVAGMAGREGAPSLASLAVGVDPAGYASVQEAMGMGLGGRDGKTKASLMEERAIAEMMKPKMEMSWDDWRVLPAKVKASQNPYFMDVKVGDNTFVMQRGEARANEPEYMKRAWAKDLSVSGSGRGDFDAEKRRLKTALAKMMKTSEGEPNRDFMSFLVRLEGRPIVAPTRNAADALREVSDAYVVSLEKARAEASAKITAERDKRLADTRMTVVLDKADATRLIQVWEGAGSKAIGFPTMVKHGDGVAIVHDDLPTIRGRLADAKPVESLRDGHRMTVVDLNALKQGVAKLGPVWDKIEMNLEGYRITSYGPHDLKEPQKTLAAPDQRMKPSELVI